MSTKRQRSLTEQLVTLSKTSNPSLLATPSSSDAASRPRTLRTKEMNITPPALPPLEPPAPPASLFLQLPFLGHVKSLKEDKGFGFLSIGRQRDVFFHFTARLPLGYVLPGTLATSDSILFALGTEPRHPDRPSAVQWALLADVDWGAAEPAITQSDLDAFRRKALTALPVADLLQLMQPSWYTQLWNGGMPRVALDDPLLLTVVCERVATLGLQDLKALPTPEIQWMRTAHGHYRQHLMQRYLLRRNGVVGRDWQEWFQARESYEGAVAEFYIDQSWPHTEMIKEWIGKIVEKGWVNPQHLQAWLANDPAAAMRHFDRLEPQAQLTWFAKWRRNPASLMTLLESDAALPVQQLVPRGALAVDLETDGEAIWEIGSARGAKPSMLFAPGMGIDMPAAMAQLQDDIDASIVLIGHNLLAWDWPILSRHLSLAQPPLLWDTLLLQYLLQPQARTHALGSSHHADEDALASYKLFESQLKRLPAGFAGDLLTGRYADFSSLVEGMGSLADAYANKMPDWLRPYSTATTVLVLHEARLREVAWVPGITVVSANPQENLAIEWLQVDVTKLAAGLQGEQGSHPAAQVLLKVARGMEAQGIALRFGMVAPWLLDACPALEQALRQACVQPKVTPTGLNLAPLPRDMGWLLASPTEEFQLVGATGEVLVVDWQPRAALPLLAAAKGHKASPLLRINTDGPQQQVWLQADRPALLLDKAAGWQSFCTVVLPKGLNKEPPKASVKVPTLRAQVSTQAAPPRSLLATRRTIALFPNTLDQAGYWIEVIRTFIELANAVPTAVPILLVGSTASTKLIDLLVTGLADIGRGEVKPDFRSRLEHLRRAERLKFALVDRVESWPRWLALAEIAGASLLPVVEALPVEQWFAAAQVLRSDSADDAQDRADADANAAIDFSQDDGEVESQDATPGLEEDESDNAIAEPIAATVSPQSSVWTVKAGDLLQRLTHLITTNLQHWLLEMALNQSNHPVRLMDARAAGLGRALQHCADLVVLQGDPLPQHQVERLQGVFKVMQVERKIAPDDYATMEQFLIQNWQPKPEEKRPPLLGFKASQKPAMEAICTRDNDVLVTLPTGEGKSVLFQVPALCRGLNNRRLTLVLSPLKALMHDQVERLHRQGFFETTDYLNSDRPAHEIAEVLQGVLDHRIVLLYVAPERLRSAVFVQVLQQRVESDGGLEFAVVDETHCVNQWGYQFRPDYFHALHLLLREFRNGAEAPPTPMLMMSATVTAFDRKQLRELVATAAVPGQTTLPFVNRPDGFVQPLQQHIQVQPIRVLGNINDRDAFEQVLEGRIQPITETIQAASDNHRKTGQRSAVLIFVTRRDHAEKLAQRLSASNTWGDKVDFFHAGLNAATREEVKKRFTDGLVNVLVATKAFGMGMDIPDIHWAVHLGPPAFLEDYLQEVGRIGRGAEERAKAGFAQLKALLLFSADDFESLRNLRAGGALHLATVKKFYDSICANAQPVDTQWLALVPQDGFDPPSHPAARRMVATQLRLALYWLERVGCIHLQGLVPRLLPVILHSAVLERIAAEGGQLGLVAQVILGVEALPRQTTPAAPVEGVLEAVGNWLGRALARLSDMVGYWLGDGLAEDNAPAVEVAAPANQGPAPGAAVVNVSQIMLRCAIESLSDVMACLVELEQRGALELKRNFQFAPRLLAQEQPFDIVRLFDAVGHAHDQLIKSLTKQTTQHFDLSELMMGWVPPAVNPAQSNHYRTAFDAGVLCLARVSGIRLQQRVNPDQSVAWEAHLALAQVPHVKALGHQTLAIARAVFKLLQPRANGAEAVVSLSELVTTTRNALPGTRFRESALKKALGLLSALRLVSLSADLLPMSYVMSLDTLHHDLNQHQNLWSELEDVNRMSELRNDAMEIFANLPSDAQNGFIKGYFAQTDSAGMEAFLIDQLRDVDDPDNGALSTFIRDKREHLRATEVVKFFDQYQKSQVPNQWEAIKHPFDQHLLVNAGPGAGKTAVLVGRIVHLIREQHMQPSEIIVLAFNRAVVFEIKKRVRDLFRTLGYGAYVKRLRVSTFHALAMRSLAQANGGLQPLPQQNQLLTDFAGRLAADARFRTQVVGSCRSILVDEFQDMTADIYQIIRQLHIGAGAGVMVIGDDDQDILRWSRPAGEFSEVYFRNFESDFGGVNLKQLSLTVNFRSGIEIVDKSQTLISQILTTNPHSRRIKNFPLLARQNPVASQVHRLEWRYRDAPQIPWRYCTWMESLGYVRQWCEQLAPADAASLAILCRTNAEVAQVHRELVRVLPGLTAQGAVNYPVANLRHVGLWLELLEQQAQRQNQTLTDDLLQALLTQYRQQHAGIPEVRQPQPTDVQLDDLWRLCLAEQSFPHLTDLTRFIREVQLDELGRLLGAQANSARKVVSTIHKVKGLEFDQVIVLPSDASFPLKSKPRSNIAMDAAEEARLFYVAMTRAKQGLTYFVSEREYAWGVSTPMPLQGNQVQGRILSGSHDEIWLSWSMIVINNFNPNPEACQRYIETQVRVGDVIRLGGANMSLRHQAANGALRQVGYLAAEVGPGNPQRADLTVSAVVRFKPTANPDGQQRPTQQLAASVQNQGWGYVVLVSGQLA